MKIVNWIMPIMSDSFVLYSNVTKTSQQCKADIDCCMLFRSSMLSKYGSILINMRRHYVTMLIWQKKVHLNSVLSSLHCMLCLNLASNYHNKLMKGKALRNHSLHEKTAASVLLKLFISSNE